MDGTASPWVLKTQARARQCLAEYKATFLCGAIGSAIVDHMRPCPERTSILVVLADLDRLVKS